MSSFPELSCASNCATYTNVECALLCAFHDTDYTSSANLILYQGSLPLCKLATAVYHRMYDQCDFTSPRVLAIFDLSYAYPYRNTCKSDHVFWFSMIPMVHFDITHRVIPSVVYPSRSHCMSYFGIPNQNTRSMRPHVVFRISDTSYESATLIFKQKLISSMSLLFRLQYCIPQRRLYDQCDVLVPRDSRCM